MTTNRKNKLKIYSFSPYVNPIKINFKQNCHSKNFMFCTSKKDEIKKFKFCESGYKISKNIIVEYKKLKHSYAFAIKKLMKYNKTKVINESDCLATIWECINFYELSEKILTILTTEILKKNSGIEKKRSIFVMLEKISAFFYLFDTCRFANIKVFNDFAVMNRKGILPLDKILIEKYTFYIAISMPMGHLFLSKFTTSKSELYTPPNLLKKTTLNLTPEKKKILYFICRILVKYKFKFISVFLIGVYNRFFPCEEFEKYIDSLDPILQSYYEKLLTLN